MNARGSWNGRCNFHKMAVAALASTPSQPRIPSFLRDPSRTSFEKVIRTYTFRFEFWELCQQPKLRATRARYDTGTSGSIHAAITRCYNRRHRAAILKEGDSGLLFPGRIAYNRSKLNVNCGRILRCPRDDNPHRTSRPLGSLIPKRRFTFFH